MENDTMNTKTHASKLPSKYLRDFFSEKDIPYKLFHKESRNGNQHVIPNTVVVEHMQNIRDPKMLKDLEKMLTMIDFKNGDVNHFLEHLAGAVVEQYDRDF